MYKGFLAEGYGQKQTENDCIKLYTVNPGTNFIVIKIKQHHLCTNIYLESGSSLSVINIIVNISEKGSIEGSWSARQKLSIMKRLT